MEIESDGNGGQNLNIKFVRDNGDIDDYFTINKSGVTLSVDQTDTQENIIKIYPVPANDLLNIKVNLNENFKTAKFITIQELWLNQLQTRLLMLVI
ncbi:hypothetical protein BKP44_05725 [Formosa algae]|nr:hypothetical protein BKP44_05725 [Formosa algae]